MPTLKYNKKKKYYKEFGNLYEQKDIMYLCMKHHINRNIGCF